MPGSKISDLAAAQSPLDGGQQTVFTQAGTPDVSIFFTQLVSEIFNFSPGVPQFSLLDFNGNSIVSSPAGINLFTPGGGISLQNHGAVFSDWLVMFAGYPFTWNQLSDQTYLADGYAGGVNLETGNLDFYICDAGAAGDSISNARSAIYLSQSNFVGIFNNTPAFTLDVAGDINFTGNLFYNSAPGFTGTGAFTNFVIESGIITSAS